MRRESDAARTRSLCERGEPRRVLLTGDAPVGGATQADPHRANVWLATVSYHVDTTGFEFPQFLNVVFGNSSIKEGLVVEEILPCTSLAKGERPAGCR